MRAEFIFKFWLWKKNTDRFNNVSLFKGFFD